MDNYTPGPWDWNIDERGSLTQQRYNRYHTLYARGGVKVLHHWDQYCDDSGLELSDEDAKLIESAPDLLEACESLLDAASATTAGDTDYSAWHRCTAADIGGILNKVRIAIKKAKGELI